MSLQAPQQSPDAQILEDLERAILKNVGGISGLQNKFPKLIRRAIDEVIDMPRTGRRILDDIEQPEKTYIGTKIEILFRSLIGYPKGLRDLNIDGVDVDIKHSIKKDWMIPRESVNEACVVISENEKTNKCSIGIVIARDEYLNAPNQDGKRGISAKGAKNIRWMLQEFDYPPNIWVHADKETVARIFAFKSGTKRLVQMFTEMQDIPITRSIIEGVGQQKDPLKRVRANGGARDALIKLDILLLSGVYHQPLIRALKLPPCSEDDFISHKLTPEEKRLVSSGISKTK